PVEPGRWVAESGRIRHFHVLDYEMAHNLRPRQIDSVLSAASREARNFPMQESVAFAAQRAGVKAIKYYRRNRGLHARILAILYDSMCTICPIEKRFEIEELHERYMTRENLMHNH